METHLELRAAAKITWGIVWVSGVGSKEPVSMQLDLHIHGVHPVNSPKCALHILGEGWACTDHMQTLCPRHSHVNHTV
jgi:hypothetical protein